MVAIKNVRTLIIDIVSYAYILLFFYTAVDKWIYFSTFQEAMKAQVLPDSIKPLLVYTLPPIEVLSAVLLMFNRTLRWGLYLSTGLMLCFTIYIGLAVANVYDEVPCTCAGVFTRMNFNQHLIFNSAFLLAGLFAIWLERNRTQLKVVTS